MPERGHRIYATHRLRISRTIEAPLPYVYAWSTDYREDDSRLSIRRPKPRFQVLRVSPGRVLRIRISPERGREPGVAVDVVRLSPPAAWHTDQIDEEDREAVDYRLVRLGPRRTRIELTITERWMIPDHPSRGDVIRRVRGAWDRYAAHIEADYRAGRPARG